MNTDSSQFVRAARVEQFMTLYSSHQKRLYLYALTLLPTSSEADDVIQDANLVLWQKFDEFEANTNFFAWACKIIRLKVLQYREKTRRHVAVLDPDILDGVANAAVEQVEHDEERYGQALHDCMARLSANDQELMRCRYTIGMAVQAIAAAVHRSPNAVSQSMGRIRRILLDCISSAIDDPRRSGVKS